MSIREDCPMRHENGNCLPCGGFCLAVNDEICQALHQAYDKGRRSGYKEGYKEGNYDAKLWQTNK